NNSVSITDAFMRAAQTNEMWTLKGRHDPSVNKDIPAGKVWNDISYSAWACADPGVQFKDTMNDWHTCPKSGPIKASNPCSEYIFLDDTACNLASINLLKFYDAGTREFDVDSYEQALRLWTIVLDISIIMAGYSSAQIAELSYKFRTLGLGYANLGGLLMTMGLAYDSDDGRSVAAALTALMTGVAYRTSAEMGRDLGAFPEYSLNKESMQRVIEKHESATQVAGYRESVTKFIPGIGSRIDLAWHDCILGSLKGGFRNAQVSLLAPTGCLVKNSIVLTDRGLSRLSRLGDVCGEKWQDVNFKVLTEEGEKSATNFFINGVEDDRKRISKRGYSIQGSLRH